MLTEQKLLDQIMQQRSSYILTMKLSIKQLPFKQMSSEQLLQPRSLKNKNSTRQLPFEQMSVEQLLPTSHQTY
jgi:hypothetical protein